MVATLAKQARETSDRIYLEEMYGMVDYHNGVPRSTLTKLVKLVSTILSRGETSWLLTMPMRQDAPPDALPPP